MIQKKVKVIISSGMVLIVVIIFFYVREKYEDDKWKNEFIHFDTTYFNGELEYVALASHAVVFKIKGNESKYIFSPKTSELNEKRIFYHLAEKGDTIIKGKLSDTLKLIKNGNEYLYTFDQLK
jgi:hypothetical protein